jgi:2'-hydroxyisoflavone reductase
MRLLIVGGTSFVGRHMTEAALNTGHEVTLANRGHTGPELFPHARHLRIDRDRRGADLEALKGHEWDATLDCCAYWPGQVRALADALDGRGGHHLHVSSVSAYAEGVAPGADESAPLAQLHGADAADPDAVDMSGTTYGPLKAACERLAVQSFGESSTAVVRPTYVVGPLDPSGRFCWWVDRLARGGRTLCPGPAGAPLQVIDARDQARFAIGLVEQRISGAFHTCSPRPPFSLGDLVDCAAEALGSTVEPVWAPADWLLQRGVDGATFPLWAEGASEGVMAMDPSAAEQAGLRPRPLADTIRETWQWMQDGGAWHREGNGLSPALEQGLLAGLDGR